MENEKNLLLVKRLLRMFIVILFLSGLTAIPIDTELSFLLNFITSRNQMHIWLNRVLVAYTKVKDEHPFLLYGYDWLAFAHFILAILFIGPYKDPVKNIWVIELG